MPRWLSAALLLALLSGCGTSDRAGIRRAFFGYYHGIDAGAAARVCRSISARYQRELVRADGVARCTKLNEIHHDKDDEPVFAHARLRGIRVLGSRARGTADFTHHIVREVEFVRVDGGWRYDGIEPKFPPRPRKPVLCPSRSLPLSFPSTRLERQLNRARTARARRILRRVARLRRAEAHTRRFDARRLIGHTPVEAETVARHYGCTVRETGRDLMPAFLTADFQTGRLDIEIERDRIVSVGVG